MNDQQIEQQRTLALALRRAELTMEELWLRYFALGGEAGLIDVDAYVHGMNGLSPAQRDMLAHAVNERLDELAWTHRAAYTRPSREGQSRSRPLAALVHLLEGVELAPPDRLPAVAETAGRALGVQVTIYLVDYEQRHLHPVPATLPANGHHRTALEVDGTLAGQAFQQMQTLPSENSGRPRLWVPLLDGIERMGVLEVAVADPADLDDPGLRTQCRWLSMLLGHLITLFTQYGDALDLVRLRTPRTANGELIWSLLPPLTAGVDSFVVTGVVEPRHAVSGDVFDYALSETTATLIVLDAKGNDLRGGLIAATALAAHRSARHAGRGLQEQARAIDETISRQFGDSAFVTAVLAELDLATGQLCYLNAGHPHPLIMRAGELVKPLTDGQRPPLGLGHGDMALAEEMLRPDDLLVMHTDGITQARDGTGEAFGEGRLADFLQRDVAAGHPPPETARRLIQAVQNHQNGALQDDATVLIARWVNARRTTP